MEEIKINAYAKINLSIDVTGKRADGYHDVVMVLQQIELRDEVIVRCNKSTFPTLTGSVEISSDQENMPAGRENIAYKAAQLMKELFPHKSRMDIHIHIEKKIPMAAGLAGGSADAAAVLHALNILWECNLSVAELMEIGVRLGADVPFCIMGQAAKERALGFKKEIVSTCALAEGIGEILTPLPPLKAFVILSKPSISVSTAQIYQSLDLGSIARHPDTGALIQGLRDKDFSKVSEAMYNVLEEVSVKKYPEIDRRRMLLCSMTNDAKVMMSGSGPTIFALTQQEELAEILFQKLKRKDGDNFLVRTSC